MLFDRNMSLIILVDFFGAFFFFLNFKISSTEWFSLNPLILIPILCGVCWRGWGGGSLSIFSCKVKGHYSLRWLSIWKAQIMLPNHSSSYNAIPTSFHFFNECQYFISLPISLLLWKVSRSLAAVWSTCSNTSDISHHT